MASGDPVARWSGLAQEASRATGIPANVLLGLIRVESGGTEGRTSSAGAGGLTQFIPGTAKEYGVDVRPGHARSQIMGAARYLKALGFSKDPQRALNAYNGAQVVNGRANPYAGNVLAAAKSYGGTVRGGGSSPADVLVSAGGGGSAGPDLSPGTDVSGAVAALLQGAQNQAPPITGPQLPAYAARAALPQGYVPPSSGGPAVSAAPDVGALLDAVRTQGGDVPGSGSSDAGGGGIQVSGGASGGGGGLATFEGTKVAPSIAPILQYARERGWKGSVTSGYRSDAEQTRIYKSGVRPAAVPKSMGGQGSMHEQTGRLQGAIDVTDAATLDRILRAKGSRLRYAGAKDPVHFSFPRGGSY